MATFHGSEDELRHLVAGAGCLGEWRSLANGNLQFRGREKANLNWAPSTGRVWFDGAEDAKQRLCRVVEAALGAPESERLAPLAESQSKTIFVIHGHDSDCRDDLELALRRLGLDPFILQNTAGGGLTIIESLERMIGKNAESSFGIVLLTPDDMGYANREGSENAKPRARQNVILEMGMLLSSLTRDRVAILQKGFIEHPSDVSGIIYIRFEEHIREAIPKLAERLQVAGITIDAGALARASA